MSNQVEEHAMIQFMREFHEQLPTPQFFVDHDGELSLDWDYGPRATLTAFFDGEGGCGYAALIGEDSQHGRTKKWRTLAPRIVTLAQQAETFAHARATQKHALTPIDSNSVESV
jgi:hypothetical protein